MPAWAMALTFPCIGSGARITLPPNAWPIAWCPRQTPNSGNLAGGGGDQFQADAGFRGRAGARRQHDRFGLHCDRIGDRQLVIAPHLTLGADIAQKMKEVEGEAVVVVDEKDHGHRDFVCKIHFGRKIAVD